MKTMITGAMAIMLGLGATMAPAPADARDKRVRYENNGRYYNSYGACRAAKRKAAKDGAIVGAATAGIGSALLGANLGEAALIAGGGALVGNQLGKAKRC